MIVSWIKKMTPLRRGLILYPPLVLQPQMISPKVIRMRLVLTLYMEASHKVVNKEASLHHQWPHSHKVVNREASHHHHHQMFLNLVNIMRILVLKISKQVMLRIKVANLMPQMSSPMDMVMTACL